MSLASPAALLAAVAGVVHVSGTAAPADEQTHEHEKQHSDHDGKVSALRAALQDARKTGQVFKAWRKG